MVTEEEDTIKVRWRSQTKSIYNLMIRGAIFIEIRMGSTTACVCTAAPAAWETRLLI